MQLQTRVPLPQPQFNISHKNKMTLIGSCFADNIGQHFSEQKFNILTNPFGTLYNPYSICQCIDTIVAGEYDESKLIYHNDIWHSFSHHGRFSHTDKKACHEQINHNIQDSRQHLLQSQYLFITLGTAYIYEYEGKPVANCHKIPSKAFNHRRLDVNEIVETFSRSIEALKQLVPELKVIFTVSPVRYIKDGLHENTLSKSILHLAVDELCHNDDYQYFPAYELVIDELRDYRFFAEDMTHPSSVTTKYIWSKIEETYFDAKTIALGKQIKKLTLAYNHRPFNTNPEAHRIFLKSMHDKALNLQKQNDGLDFSQELNYFSNQHK